jgi:hypothetical protein
MVNIFNGSFVSNGAARFINLPGQLDTMEVWNYSVMDANPHVAGYGTNYVWNNGMAYNDGLVTLYGVGTPPTFVNMSTAHRLGVPGFILYNSSTQGVSAPVATTDFGTTAHRVLTGNTAGLSVGSVVRLSNMAGANQVNGMDFTVTAVNPTVSFDIAYTPVTVAAAGAGKYRIIPFDQWYPAKRYIASIAANAGNNAWADVVLTVAVGANTPYQVGQAIRFHVGPFNGMQQIDGLEGNIVAVTPATNTVTVDINVTTFTPFVWPTTAVAAAPFTQAFVDPIGMDTSLALSFYPPYDILSDAMVNIAATGIILGAGITSPAGSNGDTIYWRATSSFNL